MYIFGDCQCNIFCIYFIVSNRVLFIKSITVAVSMAEIMITWMLIIFNSNNNVHVFILLVYISVNKSYVIWNKLLYALFLHYVLLNISCICGSPVRCTHRHTYVYTCNMILLVLLHVQRKYSGQSLVFSFCMLTYCSFLRNVCLEKAIKNYLYELLYFPKNIFLDLGEVSTIDTILL